MINRYVEVTDEYIKQLEHEIDNLKAINENHKKINGKLREEYNKIQNLYESVFAESQKQKEVISRAIELLNNPWSFESGNKEVDEITYNKKRKVIDILNEVAE